MGDQTSTPMLSAAALVEDAKRKIRHASHRHHTATPDAKKAAEELLYRAARELAAAELLQLAQEEG